MLKMIPLTAFHHKVKVDSLERYHKINEWAEERVHKWNDAISEWQLAGSQGERPPKPFIEPFEFIQSDYDITEKKFRVKPEEIITYGQNAQNITEICLVGDITVSVKETIEELDKYFDLTA